MRRRKLREQLFHAQDGCCAWCHGALASPKDGELDRIVPGGNYNLGNLVLACQPCNRTHGADVRWNRAVERVHPAFA